MKKNLIILVVGIIVVAAFIVNIFPFGNGKTKEVEFANETFEHVQVKSENAEIQIVPVDDETARAVLSGDKSNKYKLNAIVKGDTLQIEVDDRWFQFISIDFTFSTPSLTVYLPEKLYETVRVETDNGKVQVTDVEAGEINAETNNGKMEIRNVKSNHVNVETDNGQVFLENIEGEINGESDNGKITLITESLDRDITLTTDNGAINIQTENKPTNAIFDIKVDNGKVTVFGDSFYDTVIGDGDSIIKLTADNGNIRVE